MGRGQVRAHTSPRPRDIDRDQVTEMMVTDMAPSEALFKILGIRTRNSAPPHLSLPSWAGAVVTQP